MNPRNSAHRLGNLKMPLPSKRAARNAAIAATIVVGIFVFVVDGTFHPIWSNHPGLVLFFIILWLALFPGWLKEFGKLEILWHLDREAAKDQAARLRPPPLPATAYRHT